MKGYILVCTVRVHWETMRQILAGIEGVKKATVVTQLPEESSKSYDFILEVEAPDRYGLLRLADAVKATSLCISKVELYHSSG